MSLNNIEEVFNSIDTDHSGEIDYTEFIAASLDKNIYMQESKLKEAFTLFDIDNSGKISKDEIAQILRLDNKKNKAHTEFIEKLIKKYDLNGDGEIDYSEFVDMMKEKEFK